MSSDLRQKSDRVVLLTARGIQTLVLRRYGHEISISDAVDLARAHNLRTALLTLATKMEIHVATADSLQFDLALQETKLSSELADGVSIDRVVDVRRAATSSASVSQNQLISREQLQAALAAIRRESNAWTREYKEFIESLSGIYKQTKNVLDELRLSVVDRRGAQEELENVMLVAIKKASGIV